MTGIPPTTTPLLADSRDETRAAAILAAMPIQHTLGDALADMAAHYPDRTGWVFGPDRVTFADMVERTAVVTTFLKAEGISAGDAVAVWLPNVSAWAETLFACSVLGAVLVPLNTRAKPDEVAYILKDSGAKGIVITPTLLGIDFADALRQIGYEVPTLTGGGRSGSYELHWVPLDNPGSAQPFPRPSPTAPLDTDPLRGRADRPDAALLLQYTSGTTDRPKGAYLSNTFALNFGLAKWLRVGVGFGEPVLSPQPFYHVGGSCGSVTPPLIIGCQMVVPEYYDPEMVLELLEAEACVARGGMSTMYLREMQHPRFAKFDTTALRAGWTFGDPPTLRRIRDGYPVEGLVQIYGATEGGVCYGDVSEPWDVRESSAGTPAPGVEIVIRDPETGDLLPPGQTGEICWRGWATLIRYVGQPAGMGPFDEQGYFHSGDLGFLDSAGRLHVVGRLKDMIKPGGENVSAQEVEALLLGHPDVRQVAVVGVPDDDLGEAVLAFVERAPGSQLEATDLQAHFRGKVANFRIPKYIWFVDTWPLTGSGKILKRELRDSFLATSVSTPAPPEPAKPSTPVP